MQIEKSLSDFASFAKRDTPEQKVFESENMGLLVEFPLIVKRCFERLNREIFSVIEPSSRDRNLGAVVISGFLRGEIIKLFPQYCTQATTGRFKLRTDKYEWIYLKKLDNNRRPMNISTHTNDMIINQQTDSEFDEGANVFLGYTATKDMTQELEVYAVCIDGESELWFSDLRDLREKNPIQSHMSEKKETALKEGIVTIKKAEGI